MTVRATFVFRHDGGLLWIGGEFARESFIAAFEQAKASAECFLGAPVTLHRSLVSPVPELRFENV